MHLKIFVQNLILILLILVPFLQNPDEMRTKMELMIMRIQVSISMLFEVDTLSGTKLFFFCFLGKINAIKLDLIFFSVFQSEIVKSLEDLEWDGKKFTIERWEREEVSKIHLRFLDSFSKPL